MEVKIKSNIGKQFFIYPEFRNLYPKSGNGWQYYTVIQEKEEFVEVENKFHSIKFLANKNHLNIKN